MRIADVLNIASITVMMQAESKEDLLEKMVELASKTGKIKDIQIAKKEIFERERIMSTGVGKGIALPHAKTNVVDESIGSLAILSDFVDYNSLDGKPVNIVFMLIGRDSNVGNHLRLLSKISRILNNDSFRSKLIKSSSPEEVYKYFDEIETED